jgi:amino acid adenylation domain-containing protein
MSGITTPPTILHRLRDHASQRPDALALSWLNEAGARTEQLTYAQLARRVDATAAGLRSATRPGDRAILLYGPGLEFVTAFLGCLAAGVVAVPAYPPRNRRHHPRLDAIVHDAAPHVVLVGDVGSAKVDEWLARLPTALRRIDTAEIPSGDSAFGGGLLPAGADLALLQYTSGSTSTPKGVMVTHANIVHNSECLRKAFQLGAHSVGVCWLPSFHDMGLIDGVLQPLYTGFPAHLMAPSTFIQRPATWLEAITRYGGTHCGGPNFAYDACLQGVTDAQKATLDLRTWETAYNGAEPVRRETLDAFAAAFAACGFSPRQFYPCYGLAEATLIVTGSQVDAEPVYFAADADALERHDVREASDPTHIQTRHLVGCGTPVDGMRVAIVDPDTLVQCDGRVGEIWVAGPSVAVGYWRRDDATAETFAAMTSDGDGPFMRTGDLGFLRDGELFVTGRIKDLVIIRGRNHYPQDIEATAAGAHDSLARGLASCFSVEHADDERLVVVQEVPRTQARALPTDEVLQAIRTAIVDAHEVDPWDIVLVPALSLPKTSSGKLQRSETRRRYLADEFKALARSRVDGPEADAVPEAGESPPIDRSRDGIARWLVQALARTLQVSPSAVARRQPFATLGVDSLAATRLAGALQHWLQRPVSPTLVYDYPTVEALAAHLAGDEDAAVERGRAASTEPVAIIGIGCRVPGARGPREFWHLLCDGVDAVGSMPSGRWRDDLFHPEPGQRGKHYAPRGGFLDAVDMFDAGFFNISPNEADRMDPQQRLLLETTWEAFEDAGVPVSSLAGSETGVFVGVSTSDYRALQFGSPDWLDHHAGTGNAASIAANRISYLFDLQGPSLAVDTACSSSLLAVHLAGESLRSGECRLAVAGGVNLMLTPDLTVAFSQARMLSPSGACKAFDAGADGYVRGEGCGMVVLKRLSDAVRDGDPIVAVIRGSAVNQDGRTNGLTAPNGLSQQRVLRQALTRAGVDPASVQYVEAHGTGTPLGDPIEMHAIRAVYGTGRPVDTPLFVGSVKANVGHLEAAAGIASLVKTALALQARTLVPQLHFSTWNPEIDLQGAPVEIPRAITPWPSTPMPRAVVSAFGFGGTNVHVVLEAAPALPEPPAERDSVVPLLLSARTPAALRTQVEHFRDHLRVPGVRLDDVAYTAAAGRDHFAVRMGVTGASAPAVADALDTWLTRAAASTARTDARVAFFFTGQGSQYSGMAEALSRHAVARDVLERLTARLQSHHDLDLRSLLLTSSSDGDAALAHTRLTQPALYIVQCALVTLWRSWGVEPAAVIGHSVGEFAAAWTAGVFGLEDGLDLIATRGRLMETLGQPGAMVAVSAHIDQVTTLADGLGLDVAALNAAAQVVMSGTHQSVAALVTRCEAAGVTATTLATSHAFHSALIDPALPGLMEAAARVPHHSPTLPWMSNVTGEVVTDAPTPEYWRVHARQPVRFEAGVRELQAMGITAGLEIGPSPVLTTLARRTLSGVRTWAASLDRRRAADDVLAGAVVTLHSAGVAVNGRGLFPEARRVSLPTYPFAQDRHWFEAPGPAASRPAPPPSSQAQFYDVEWEAQSFPQPAFGPDPQRLQVQLSVLEPAMRAQTRTAQLPEALQSLDTVALDWAHAALAELAGGARLPAHANAQTLDDADVEAWNRRLGVAPRHHRLAGRVWRWLVAHERVVRADDGWVVTAPPDPPQASARVVADYPEVRCEAELLTRCGPRLVEVLRGQLDPLHLLFPGGDFSAAAAIYTEAPAAQLLNGQAAAALAQYLEGRDRADTVRLLELGAGTGGLTTYMLPVLAAWGGDYEYVFTDLSPSFLEQARDNFSAYSGVEYRLLDLEALGREPAGHYDIALAANAVHAVARLAPVLCGLRGVLRPGGQLWLLEGVQAQGWLDLTFGLTEGWWKAADGDGRSSYPLLPVDRWCRMLTDAGFVQPLELSASSAVAPYALIGAARAAHSTPDTTTRWVLAGGGGALQDALHGGLRGCPVVDVAVTHLGETLALPRANDIARTHVVVCLDDVVTDGRHPEAVASESVTLSTMFLDVLRTVVRHPQTRVSVVTRGARPHPAPGKAGRDRLSAASVLWGLGKTASLECPEHWGGLIDLDPAGDPVVDAERLIEELTDVRADDQQVWRGDVRWVPRLRTRAVVVAASGWPTARGSVLVTGGTGAMGVQAVAGLARAGYRHFCLMSRRGHLTDESAVVLNAVRAQGAVVQLVQGDAADPAAVTRALDVIARDGQSLQGVVHAAGVAHAESLATSTREDLERVYRAKVQALLVLDTRTRDRGLDFFVAFSSMVSLWGAKGQAVYAAGNHFLDDWAAIARQDGVPARTINWGPVSGGGMVPASELATLVTLGVRALPLETIPRLLAQAMTVSSPQVAVIDMTWDVFRAHLESRGARPFFDGTRTPDVTRDRASAAGDHDELRDLVRREVAMVLGHSDVSAIDTERGFFDIGLDSLTIVQLKTRLEQALGLTLPSTLGLEYPSIEALAAHIRSMLSTTTTVPAAVAPRAPVTGGADEPIAIVGIGCRFPGGASDPASYWALLRDRVDAVRPFPVHRWRDIPPFSEDPDAPGTIATRMGGFLDHIDHFDADFFRLSAREASSLDPQHRLLLQVAWDALEDAGAVYPRSAGARVGVFAGVSASDYARRLTVPDAYYATGNALNAAPGRISYLFGFRGPSLAVDTACSSSLVAIRLACQSLRAGECDAALAGGVNLILSMETTQSLSRAKVLSPEGRCRAFDAAADGMARAEGCGLVLLKPLSQARADGDRIYALIRAAGVNQDGASGGFTVPSREAQEDLMRRTLASAGVQASAVDYVEAHGTGTPLGDPIEVRALATVFSEARPSDRPLRIGSVKTNLGHTESASGVAGLIKTALALWHEEIPAQLHFSTPSPHIDWDQMPIRVVTERTAWPTGGRPRLAGVSSFGLSGTNAHVVLAEAPPASTPSAAVPVEGLPLVVSASSDTALRERRLALASWLETMSDDVFRDVAYTLSARRAHLAHRWAAVCGTRQEAIARLRADGGPHRRADAIQVSEAERLAAAYAHGAAVDWPVFWRGREGRVISLPRYPFQARSFWIDVPSSRMPPASSSIETSMTDSDNVRSEVVRLVAQLLQESPETIDVTRPFLEMGADSIILTEAITAVQRRFGVTIAIRQMFESLTTIDALAQYIVAQGGTVEAVAASVVPPPVVAPVSAPAVSSVPTGNWDAVFAQQFQQASQVLTQLAQQQLAFLASQQGVPAAPVVTPVAAAPSSAAPAAPVASPAGSSGFWTQETPDTAPLSPRQQAHLDALIERYVEKTRRSKQCEQRDRPVFADMRTAIGFRLETKEMSYPIVATRSEGAHFWDVDGNEYVDMCMGFGVAFFGHQPSFVVDAITEQLKEGLQVGPQSRHAAEVARLICEMTGMERVTFCNSGTEAVMTALRVVRAATGRQRIVTFTGSYHGHSDPTLALAGTPGRGDATVPMAPGVSPAAIGDTIVLPYGLEKSLDVIDAQAPTLAAVLVEPVQSRRPGLHPAEFLRKVREITRRHNVPLIFDEMITGFRIHPGGAQVDFGVEADIATYGKMIGGGMPLGVVAARGAFLDRIDGGAWHYGDGSYPAVERTFYAGTFCKHPLAMAAARAVLTELKRRGPAVQAELNERTHAFVASINTIFESEGVPLNLVHYGSLMRFNLAGNFSYLYQPLEMDVFCHHLIERGVYIWEGRTLFLSTAHTDADLDTIRTAVRGAVRDMKAGGFFGNGSEPDPTPIPLTEAQRDLWVMSQLGEDGARAYQESIAIEIDGEVDAAVLMRAATWLAARHEALRTTISADGQTQVVTSTPVVDCHVASSADVAAAMAEEARVTINLTTGPLWRVRAWTQSTGKTTLAVYGHHIVVDGWSMGLLLEELSVAYRAFREGRMPERAAAPSFHAFLAAREARLTSASTRTAREYWRARFADAVPSLDLPLDGVRPALKTFAASRIVRTLPEGVHRQLSALGAHEGCSVFMTVLAAYATLLHRLSGATDVVVGVPVSGRPSPSDGQLVGFCTHIVPVRITLDPEQSFTTLLGRVRTAVLDAFDHQEWPFGRMLDDIHVEPDLSRTPVFTTTFNLDRPLAVSEFAGMPATLVAPSVCATTYDLSCNVVVDGERMVVSWDANSDLWRRATLDQWTGHFETLLTSLATSPTTSVARLPWMDPATRTTVESVWNNTGMPPAPFETLHAWVDEGLRRAGDAEVFVCGGERVTGRQLDERARSVEASLRERGVGCGDLVGVSAPRSVDLVAALLAVLRTGAAYVPLDPGFPKARLSRMIEHSGLSWIVQGMDGGALELVKVRESVGMVRELTPSDPAYVIYTSASTGDPKGVVISHGAVVNLLQTMGLTLGASSSDTWLAITTISFDISVLEIFLPLTHGVRLVMARTGEAQDGHALVRLLDQERVSFMQATPAGWRLMLESGWSGMPTLTMLCGGEALPPVLAQQLLTRGRAVWNVYGPTETTIWSTAVRVTDPARVTIGRPLGNTQVYVTSAHGELQPPGVPGELWIGGAGLALGYHRDQTNTLARFVANPFEGPSPRLYRTGDLVRWTGSGELEFRGRLDHQVKVRGFRIELGEVEASLATLDGVAEAVAHVVDTSSGERALAVWYTVVDPSSGPDEDAARRYLASQLPVYMVPTMVSRVAAFPTTPNGKIDKRALVESSVARVAVTEAEAPQTPTEIRIATLWSEVLRVPTIGRHDDFLTLGGNSLLATRVATRLGVVTVREVLEHRTVAGLAALLDAKGSSTRVEIVL